MARPSAATSALWPAAHHLYDALLDVKLGYRCKWYLTCLIRTPPGGEPMHEGLSRAASFRNSSCIRSLGSVGAMSSSTHFLLHLAARQDRGCGAAAEAPGQGDVGWMEKQKQWVDVIGASKMPHTKVLETLLRYHTLSRKRKIGCFLCTGRA